MGFFVQKKQHIFCKCCWSLPFIGTETSGNTICWYSPFGFIMEKGAVWNRIFRCWYQCDLGTSISPLRPHNFPYQHAVVPDQGIYFSLSLKTMIEMCFKIHSWFKTRKFWFWIASLPSPPQVLLTAQVVSGLFFNFIYYLFCFVQPALARNICRNELNSNFLRISNIM